MKGSLALLALAGVAFATPVPQASTADGCMDSYPGTFQITVVNVTTSPAKRELQKRQGTAVTISLEGGVMTDSEGRTGCIVANHQFQFDNPIQDNAIYTSGWSVCSNGSLAIHGNAIFYQCLSGDFYNLYDESQGGQCGAIYIVAMGGSAAATVASDGQPQATTQVTELSDGQPQATTLVTQISDGQIQATTMMITQISDGQIQAPAVTQISDGQIQAPSGPAVTQISDGQIQATTAPAPPPAPAVTQISDGQIQATTAPAPPPAPAVTQISDGQIQATTAAPAPAVTQISDGQIQATTGAPAVTQISDGQIQATTGAPAVTQISDGQIQATTGAPVTQISDGQVQATTAAVSSFTGAGHRELPAGFAMVAGLLGAVALL